MNRIYNVLFMVVFILGGFRAAAWAAETRIVLVDCSGTMGGGARSPFEANGNVIRKVILTTPKDSQLYVFGFGKGTPVPLLTAKTPKIAGPQGQNLKATLDAGVRKFEENMQTRRKEIDPSGTDIEGALFRAARIFSEAKAGDRTLFVTSDMQQDSVENKLTLSRLQKGLGRAKKVSSSQVPDLRGTKVYIYSAFSDTKGMTTGQIEQSIKMLREYWTGYFKNSGAQVVEYKTNY